MCRYSARILWERLLETARWLFQPCGLRGCAAPDQNAGAFCRTAALIFIRNSQNTKRPHEGAFWYLARPERFELPTARFVAEYSIQLSYGRIVLCRGRWPLLRGGAPRRAAHSTDPGPSGKAVFWAFGHYQLPADHFGDVIPKWASKPGYWRYQSSHPAVRPR